MKLSASLSFITLLSSQDLSGAAHRHTAPAILERRLRRKEQAAAAGRGSSRRGDEDTGAPATVHLHGNLGKTHSDATADRGSNAATNTHGVVLVRDDGDDSLTYEYGEQIKVRFEVVEDEIDREVLRTLDVNSVGKWTVGLYMRMARPGPDAPIVSVVPKFEKATGRGLQRGGGKAGEITTAGLGGTVAGGRGGGGSGRGKAASSVDSVNSADSSGYSSVASPADSLALSEDLVDFVHEDGTDVEGLGEDNSPYQDGFDVFSAVTTPDLPLAGTATFAAASTAASKLDVTLYGTGFDAYLLDQDNNAIVGPAEIRMAPGAAAATAGTLGAGRGNGGGGRPAAESYGLVKFANAQKKRKKKTAGMSALGVATLGLTTLGHGTGKNGAPILSTAGSLGTYILETDAPTYPSGAAITVTYDIHPDLGATGTGGRQGGKVGRGSRARRAKAIKMGRGNGGRGKGNNVEVVAATSGGRSGGTDQADKIVAASGRGGGKANNDPAVNAKVNATSGGRGGGKNGADEVAATSGRGSGNNKSDVGEVAVTPGRGGKINEGSIGGATGGLKGSRGNNGKIKEAPPSATTTVASVDTPPSADDTDVPPLEYDYDKTTTTAPTVNMGADDEDEMESPGDFLDDLGLDGVDPADVKQYKIAILMNHARAQGSDANTVREVPLCPEPCTRSDEDLLSGTVKFLADDLDTAKNGNGFSVWVLNGSDEEVAGPVNFALEV